MDNNRPLLDIIIYDVINEVSFTKVGNTLIDMKNKQQIENQDISVRDIELTTEIEASAAGYPENHFLLSLALTKKDSKLFPSDIKYISPDDFQTLLFPDSPDEKYIFSLLGRRPKNKDTSSKIKTNFKLTQVSYTLQSVENEDPPQFIPHLNQPSLNGDIIEVISTSDELSTNIIPISTMVIISSLKPLKDILVPTPIINIIQEGWDTKISLKNHGFKVDELPTNYRIEVLRLGRSSDLKNTTGTLGLTDEITHISRSLQDY